MLTCVSHCIQKKDDCVTISGIIPGYAYCVPIMAFDVVGVAQIFIYYYVYASLKSLKDLMKGKYVALINVRKQFVMIADCCDKISALYGKLVSTFYARALSRMCCEWS